MTITGFRPGSIISDYIVTLRSLTDLTSAEIKAKVTAVKEKLLKNGQIQGPIDATKLSVNGFVTQSKTAIMSAMAKALPNGSGTTKVSVKHEVNNAKLATSSRDFPFLMALVLLGRLFI